MSRGAVKRIRTVGSAKKDFVRHACALIIGPRDIYTAGLKAGNNLAAALKARRPDIAGEKLQPVKVFSLNSPFNHEVFFGSRDWHEHDPEMHQLGSEPKPRWITMASGGLLLLLLWCRNSYKRKNDFWRRGLLSGSEPLHLLKKIWSGTRKLQYHFRLVCQIVVARLFIREKATFGLSLNLASGGFLIGSEPLDVPKRFGETRDPYNSLNTLQFIDVSSLPKNHGPNHSAHGLLSSNMQP
ncbi:unnamed protein product [Dovyalis caffra]|uniref:Uncharacterized protein n=1 Tax=Dovyalis caffra TaxID=77055 RepID=A0AAV1RQ59_9ROSI|nr:unnamed protein product [Dovyalis caffra]